MKRGFIRALYGAYGESRIMKHRCQIDNDINNIVSNKYNEDYVAYVFGQQNYDGIKDRVKCVLVDKNPAPFDQEKHTHRNKLELIKYAMNEDKYDEVVFLDWDCVPERKLPTDFWDNLGKREVFQACLQTYKHPKCLWREVDKGIVPNGGFVYLRNKNYVELAIKCWEQNQQDNEEPAWAKMLDDLHGGWIGKEKYWELYEAMNCKLHKRTPYADISQKEICFVHYHG